ncbi:LacI family DNA-binding transcriptional regulator [Gammaproteobacteria bacterium]|nr:LacI family DNA-binding transcriptional regulator [Gammaproteobacteria bacterium]
MAVTIKDVSKDAAVSIKTVSRVINNEENVAKATKAKVLLSVKKLGFKPNKSAQSLRSKKSYMLALLYDNPNKSYLADVQSGIFNACKNTGYNLVIQECDYKSNELKNDIVQFVEDFKIDGLIVTPPLSDMAEFLQNLDNYQIEYSVIAPSTLNTESLYVSSNDYEAAFTLTSQIIKHGHKDIGFIKGHPKHSASHLRFNGYLDAMKSHGIEKNDQWIKQGNFSFKSGFDAGVEIFHSEKIPTAIFASNDSMAAGIMKSAQMKGMKVPNDLSLAGFDDSPIAHQIWPALTTVKQPVEKMAAHAAKILIAKFDGLAEQTKSKEFKSELIMRESLKTL